VSASSCDRPPRRPSCACSASTYWRLCTRHTSSRRAAAKPSRRATCALAGFPALAGAGCLRVVKFWQLCTRQTPSRRATCALPGFLALAGAGAGLQVADLRALQQRASKAMQCVFWASGVATAARVL